MNRSYLGDQSLYGCPVGGVREWVYPVECGGKPHNVGRRVACVVS
jgi:hypothetical protein